MALSELLWACPRCGEDRGLTPDGDGFRCRACGTRYLRGRGASIRARLPDGSEIVRAPREWLSDLPRPETLVRQRLDDDSPLRSARVGMARVTGSDTVFGEGGYLNRIEIWGEEAPGRLTLFPDRLAFSPPEADAQEPPEGSEGVRAEIWPLETLRAVQASSHTLQINPRGSTLASFRFHDDSVYLWEELLHAALRDFYGRTGRGEIMEFQPRIVTA